MKSFTAGANENDVRLSRFVELGDEANGPSRTPA